jgi:Interferon-induced transmembrane protein/zinc-ribbon domain
VKGEHVNCPNCGVSNLDNATICINCGRPLTAAGSQAPTSSYTPPPPPPPTGQSSYTAPPQGAGGPQIPNYLWQSIVVTLCCCLPFGVVGIVYAVQVNNKLAMGDHPGAAEASKNAKMWTLIGLAVGLLAWVLWMVGFGAAFIQGVREGMQS